MPIKNFDFKRLLAAIILLPFLVWPQSKVDSILSTATSKIYENPDNAIALGMELLDKEDISTDEKVKVILFISTAYSSKREYEKSLEYALSAIEYLPVLKDEKLKISLFNRIGGQYQQLKIYEKTIFYLDKALELIDKLPDDEAKFQNLGTNNMLRGFVYREQMSCEIGLNYFEKAIKDFEKALHTNGGKANISISYYNRGNCLITMGRMDDAKISFIESINYAKQADAISLIAFAQKGLAQIYTSQEQYNKAIDLLAEALQSSEEVGDKILNRSIYDALATNYMAVGDFKKYAAYRNKNMAVHKQITNVERKTINDAINNVIATNSEKIISIKNKTQNLQIVFGFLIFLCLILIIRKVYLSEKILKSLEKRMKL